MDGVECVLPPGGRIQKKVKEGWGGDARVCFCSQAYTSAVSFCLLWEEVNEEKKNARILGWQGLRIKREKENSNSLPK